MNIIPRTVIPLRFDARTVSPQRRFTPLQGAWAKEGNATVQSAQMTSHRHGRPGRSPFRHRADEVVGDEEWGHNRCVVSGSRKGIRSVTGKSGEAGKGEDSAQVDSDREPAVRFSIVAPPVETRAEGDPR